MNFFKNIRLFFTDVMTEFKRVTWPTRQDTLHSTGVVLFVTIVVAIYLGAIDVGLAWLVKLVI